MEPLGMEMSYVTFDRVADKTKVIDSHVPVSGVLTIADRLAWTVSDAAGL
jgi:hypothetical protein